MRNAPESFDELAENAVLDDAIAAEAMELAAKIKRASEKFLALSKQDDAEIQDLREGSEQLVDLVYELETLLADPDEGY